MKVPRLLIVAGAFLMISLPAPRGGTALAQEPTAVNDTDDPGIDLSSLTAEQLAELVARAAAARLKNERDVVAAEIKSDLLYLEEDSDAAIDLLRKEPANTQEDNIDRICRAFARANSRSRFAEGYKAFADRKYDEALKKMKAILDPQQSTYFSAACHYVYAESLFKLGKYDDAAEAYSVLLAVMPDRISFAAASAEGAAQAFENTNRFRYAAEMYVYCLQNYGLTMVDKELDRIVKRLEYLKGIYEDPMGAVADRMGQVRSRLESLDSGEQTREKQKEIIAVLEDLIKTDEEKQRQGGSSSQSQQQSQKQSEQQKPQEQGSAQATSGASQGRPTKPATTGYVRTESLHLPKEPHKFRSAEERTDDWAKKPPEERKVIEKAMQELLPERYKQLIIDYRKELSKGAGEQEE
ncbi:MAG TPA: CDC27 family protein [Phycisphaerae bacterium]|nr:CDC27 family protein [Phycisphaerae bacterium]